MIARARGEKQHGFGAGRPQDWRLRRGCSPIEASGERGSVPASRCAFEREASGRDAPLVSKNITCSAFIASVHRACLSLYLFYEYVCSQCTRCVRSLCVTVCV